MVILHVAMELILASEDNVNVGRISNLHATKVLIFHCASMEAARALKHRVLLKEEMVPPKAHVLLLYTNVTRMANVPNVCLITNAVGYLINV